MLYSEVIDAAKNVRDEYFLPGLTLREAFEKIFEKKRITLSIQEKGEKLKKEADGSYTITLPRDTSPLRDNYTIAHELGHIFLNHPLNAAGEIHRCQERTRIEREANVFAAELLMPRDKFIEACAEYDNDSYAVASVFSVSPTAAAVRMSILNIT